MSGTLGLGTFGPGTEGISGGLESGPKGPGLCGCGGAGLSGGTAGPGPLGNGGRGPGPGTLGGGPGIPPGTTFGAGAEKS